MTSWWYEAFSLAEKQCFEQGHHDDGRRSIRLCSPRITDCGGMKRWKSILTD